MHNNRIITMYNFLATFPFQNFFHNRLIIVDFTIL